MRFRDKGRDACLQEYIPWSDLHGDGFNRRLSPILMLEILTPWVLIVPSIYPLHSLDCLVEECIAIDSLVAQVDVAKYGIDKEDCECGSWVCRLDDEAKMCGCGGIAGRCTCDNEKTGKAGGGNMKGDRAKGGEEKASYRSD